MPAETYLLYGTLRFHHGGEVSFGVLEKPKFAEYHAKLRERCVVSERLNGSIIYRFASFYQFAKAINTDIR